MTLSYDQKRNRRERAVRPRSTSSQRFSRRALELGRAAHPEAHERPRPRTRAECIDAPRPCPFVGCKHHLDVSPVGSIKLNFPDLEVHEMRETCALDVADRDGISRVDVGRLLNVGREGARQIEVKALAKVEHRCNEQPRRHLPILDEEDDL